MKLRAGLISLCIGIASLSCSSEKLSLPPGSDDTGGSLSELAMSLPGSKEKILHASEISNLTSTLPKFSNTAVNAEATVMGINLTNYLKADKANNTQARDNAYRDFVHTYKKLQGLRHYLAPEEDEVLNRYLVKIKTNMEFLKSQTPNPVKK